MTNKAFLFPGQGSQIVGMGKELYESFDCAKEVFEEVDDSLNQKLSKIIFEGSEEDLTLTSNTQPALMAVSVAVIRVLTKESGKNLNEFAKYVAGHSLGEYSALCASGALSLSDTAKLLRIRGNAMQEAVPKGKGGMVALIGTEFEQAQEICQKIAQQTNEPCEAANDNGGGQVVVSGSKLAMEKIVEIAPTMGIKKAVMLNVSAPFHSSMMKPAALKMQEALANVTINKPIIPLIANVDAKETSDPETIRINLVKQVTDTVRFRESILNLVSMGVKDMVECGSGKVLAGLCKRIDREINCSNLLTPESIEEYLK